MDREDIERLTRVEAKVNQIAGVLLDNGQRGFVTKTNDRLSDLETNVATNSGAFRVVKTVLGIVGTIMAAISGALLQHLWRANQ